MPSAWNALSPSRRWTPLFPAPSVTMATPSLRRGDRASLWWHKAPLRGSGGAVPGSLWPISLWGRQGPSAQPPSPSAGQPGGQGLGFPPCAVPPAPAVHGRVPRLEPQGWRTGPLLGAVDLPPPSPSLDKEAALLGQGEKASAWGNTRWLGTRARKYLWDGLTLPSLGSRPGTRPAEGAAQGPAHPSLPSHTLLALLPLL